MRTLKKLLGCITLSLLTGTAMAVPISINLNSPDSREDILNSTYAMQYNYTEDDLDMALTGWSYGTTTVCTRYRRGQCKETETVLNEAIEQAYVGKWDGLGVEKTDSPNHAVDNEGGDYDMHLLSFDELVILTSLDLGWYQNDTDISILAFNGDSFDSSSLLGKKWQDLIGNGWEVVGNYYNVDYHPNSGAVNGDQVAAQYWLVGAYNDKFGGFSGDNRNKSSGNDYYKLRGVTVERPPVEVPEPSALLLMLAGLLGLGWTRRLSTSA